MCEIAQNRKRDRRTFALMQASYYTPYQYQVFDFYSIDLTFGIINSRIDRTLL